VRKAAWIVAVAGLVGLLGIAFCGVVTLALGRHPMPERVGNNPPGGLAVLNSPDARYRIGVLGDAQKGLSNLANVVRAVQKEEVAFMLQTGDLVSTNDEGHYRLAALTLERAGLAVRMVVVPGNHDLKGSPARFTREIGNLETRFRRGRVAFVVINNATGRPPEERVLDEALRGLVPEYSVVLAMHVPPFDASGAVQEGYEPFLEWLAKSGVKYLLCGHVHGYFRKQVGRTTVIVNGVGGDYDAWQLGQKVHATILEIDGTSITDRPIELPPEHGLWENMEHLAIGHVAEAYRQHPVLAWGGTLLAAVLTGFAIGVLRLKRP
jgi:Icc-related predicted phosphoesterase